jgi:hypothetical protein
MMQLVLFFWAPLQDAIIFSGLHALSNNTDIKHANEAMIASHNQMNTQANNKASRQRHGVLIVGRWTQFFGTRSPIQQQGL